MISNVLVPPLLSSYRKPSSFVKTKAWIRFATIERTPGSKPQGPVKVVLGRIKIPLNLPLQKGDFQCPLLEKGGKGGFSEKEQFTQVKLTLTLPRG